jgi:hypothetical protein
MALLWGHTMMSCERFKRRQTARSIRVELTDDYLAMIAVVEALPQNQSGSDKSRRGRPGRAHRALRVVGPLLPKQP